MIEPRHSCFRNINESPWLECLVSYCRFVLVSRSVIEKSVPIHNCKISYVIAFFSSLNNTLVKTVVYYCDLVIGLHYIGNNRIYYLSRIRYILYSYLRALKTIFVTLLLMCITVPVFFAYALELYFTVLCKNTYCTDFSILLPLSFEIFDHTCFAI